MFHFSHFPLSRVLQSSLHLFFPPSSLNLLPRSLASFSTFLPSHSPPPAPPAPAHPRLDYPQMNHNKEQWPSFKPQTSKPTLSSQAAEQRMAAPQASPFVQEEDSGMFTLRKKAKDKKKSSIDMGGGAAATADANRKAEPSGSPPPPAPPAPASPPLPPPSYAAPPPPPRVF